MIKQAQINQKNGIEAAQRAAVVHSQMQQFAFGMGGGVDPNFSWPMVLDINAQNMQGTVAQTAGGNISVQNSGDYSGNFETCQFIFDFLVFLTFFTISLLYWNYAANTTQGQANYYNGATNWPSTSVTGQSAYDPNSFTYPQQTDALIMEQTGQLQKVLKGSVATSIFF